MEAINTVILIVCVTATAGWCGYVWVTRGASAWRAPLAGAFVIGAAGAVASGILGHRPLSETLLLALIYGASASVVVGGIQFAIWIREAIGKRRAGS